MRYYSFNKYLKDKFGVRVHRLAVNAGFTCPNRDGTLSMDGCIFCNEEGFSPYAGTRLSVERQLERGMKFTGMRYGAKKFIAYFQNASGTYGTIGFLEKTYDIIRKYPDIVGISISTRPDCVDEEKLRLIADYGDVYDIWMEYGMQTMHDRTLEAINRWHTFEQTKEAIINTDKMGIKVGVHVMLGLPGETQEDMMKTADTIASLPVSGIKFHVLHVLQGTRLEQMYNEGKEDADEGVPLMGRGEYVNILCRFLERIPKSCVILRLVSDAREDVLIAPEWIKQKQKVIADIEGRMEYLDTFQGRLA